VNRGAFNPGGAAVRKAALEVFEKGNVRAQADVATRNSGR
jgi:hypothetical protein